MALLFLVSFTGVYYCFSGPFVSTVNWVTKSSRPPAPPLSRLQAGPVDKPSIDEFLQTAEHALMHGKPHTIALPQRPRQAVRVATKVHGDLAASNVYLDRYSGQVLRVDEYSKMPLGARILGWMGPLHFGTFGGTWSKVIWFILGFVPVLMFGTGSIMWWNRVVSKKFSRATSREEVPKRRLGDELVASELENRVTRN